MPLTGKGEQILSALTTEYGAEKGKEVLYAGKNAGTFTGIDAQNIQARLDAMADAITTLDARFDALWNEGNHPRSENGQFGSGGKSTGYSIPKESEFKSSGRKIEAAPRRPLDEPKSTLSPSQEKEFENFRL